jgi:hypothetical protein
MAANPGTNPDTPKPTGSANDQDFEAVRASMRENMSQEEADRQARIEYLRSLTGHHKTPKRHRHLIRLLKIVLTIAIIGAFTAGVFWYFSKAGENSKNKQANKGSSQQQSQGNKQQDQPKSSTKHFDSANFSLGFDYPNDWKVTDKGDGKLTVASGVSSFKSPSGGTVKAQVVFMIQPKQNSLAAFASGDGLATRTSEILAYAKPTPNQRAQTYTTFVTNAGTANSGLNTVYVTGDLGYQKGQNVPQKDVLGGDPLVSIFFAKCNGSTCAADPTSAKTAIADSAWSDNNQLVKQVKALLSSLTIN